MFLGFHLSALGGLYCDHGNKLMRGNYSSRTGTFFCIWLHSRNVIHLLWVKMKKFFHQQKPSEKRQNFEDLQVSNLRHHCPGIHSETYPRLPSFIRELQQIMLA